MGVFFKDVGIDLGTSSTAINVSGRGVVVQECSMVAINQYTDIPIAFGDEAREIYERTPKGVETVKPLVGGVIADFENTQRLLNYLMKKAFGESTGFYYRTRTVVSVPSGVTEVEERAVEEVAYRAGAKDVYLIEGPMAAAIGAGIEVNKPYGNMVVNIGGGISEMAVISLGGIVNSRSLRAAGDDMDLSIINYLKKEYGLLIGAKTAEKVKKTLGAAIGGAKEEYEEICGRNLVTGLPKTIRISSSDIELAIKDCVSMILDGIKFTIERTPPELSADIMERGIMLTGGGALLKGLDRLIYKETGMPVHIAVNPLSCGAIGAGKVFEGAENLKTVLFSSKKAR